MIAAEKTAFQIRRKMEQNQKENFPNIVIIPTGSIEQHGPLLPLNTDTVISEAASREIDDLEGGRLFLYPAIQYTNADSAMDFPGTLSVSHDAFRQVLRDVIRSVKEQRFDAILFLDGHAINRASLVEIAYESVSQSFRQGEPFPVIVLGAHQFYGELQEKYDFEIGRHADWFEALLFTAARGVMPDASEHEQEQELFPQKVTIPPGVYGIPLKMRSNQGVIGRLSGPPHAQKLEEPIWRDLVSMIYESFKNSIEIFSLFGPER